MARVKIPNGILYLLSLLVVVVIVSVVVIRRSINGFTDTPQASVNNLPNVPMEPGYVPDKNTDYLCRSPHRSGVPCPEGQFCDGTQQACVNKTIFDMPADLLGYFS